MPNTGLAASVLAALAALMLAGCAGGRSAAASPGPPGYPHLADGRRPEGMCMWAGSDLRTCLHFAFGACAIFGDRCEQVTYEGVGAPSSAPAPAP